MRILNYLFLGLAVSAYAAVDSTETVTSQPEPSQTEVQVAPTVAPSQEPSQQPLQSQKISQQAPQSQQPLPPPQSQQPMMLPQYAPHPQIYPTAQYVQPSPVYAQRPVAQPMQQPRPDTPEKVPEKNYIHNGFFFEADLGVRYMRLENKEYDDYYDEKNGELIVGDDGNSAESRFKGFGPDFGLKFGGIVASRLALYCNLEFSSMDGNFKASRTENGWEKSNADFETDAIRFAFGGGTHFFFTPDPNSTFYGTFIGVSVSIVAEEAGLTSSHYDHEELEISKSDLSFGLQLGKVWMVNDSWNVGLTVKGSLDGGIRDGESGNDSDYYSLSANLAVIRK
jgi:hypothetical protein